MGYKAIPSALIAVGRAVTQPLLFLVKNNFTSHETRLLELETQGSLLAAGVILEFAGAAAPTGFLSCNGSQIAIATYPDLYAIIGTTYNTGGESAGNFRLPDMRGRCAVGTGTGSGLTTRAMAASSGAETVALSTSEMPSHTHSISETSHSHSNVYKVAGGAGTSIHPSLNGSLITSTRTTNFATTGITVASAGGASAHNNMQPSAVVNYIIKT